MHGADNVKTSRARVVWVSSGPSSSMRGRETGRLCDAAVMLCLTETEGDGYASRQKKNQRAELSSSVVSAGTPPDRSTGGTILVVNAMSGVEV